MLGWFKKDRRQEGFDYAKQMLAEGTYSIKENKGFVSRVLAYLETAAAVEDD